jgi:hypothetical protein
MAPLKRKTADDEPFCHHAQGISARPQTRVLGPREVTTRRLRALKVLFGVTAAVVPILTLTTIAWADDDKTYVGAQCRPVSNQQPFPSLDETNGGMFNESTIEQKWICPVVRDEMDEDPPTFARITVIEGTRRISCTFEARDAKGGGHTSKFGSPYKGRDDPHFESIKSFSSV